MALITRLARLFRADLHAVLDRLEEPETLLRQALREMEEAQAQDRQRLRSMGQCLAQAETREADLNGALAAADGQLAASLEAGQDDLARAVIRRRLEAEQALKALSRRRAELSAAQAELGARVTEQHARLESVRQKVEVLASQDAAATQAPDWADLDPLERLAPDLRVRSADVDLALLAAKQARQADQEGGMPS